MAHPQKPRLQKKRRLIIGAAAAALSVAFVIALLAVSMPAIERQLNRWQLLPQHQQLTELALDNPAQLPKTYSLGQDHAVQFVVHNRSTQDVTYSYTITENNPAGNRHAQLGSGSVQVPANSTVHVSKVVVPADLGVRVHLAVQLDNGLSVGYWVER